MEDAAPRRIPEGVPEEIPGGVFFIYNSWKFLEIAEETLGRLPAVVPG